MLCLSILSHCSIHPQPIPSSVRSSIFLHLQPASLLRIPIPPPSLSSQSSHNLATLCLARHQPYHSPSGPHSKPNGDNIPDPPKRPHPPPTIPPPRAGSSTFASSSLLLLYQELCALIEQQTSHVQRSSTQLSLLHLQWKIGLDGFDFD